jgi:glycosyltransferase involved in cell wall biosynthesis
MRILIVIPEQNHASGNWVTARRFQQGLEQLGYRVKVIEICWHGEESFQDEATGFAPDVALLLHAYRSGRPWLENTQGQGCPTVVMLTGTDVNHGLDDPEQSNIIQVVIDRAACVILHNPIIAAELARNRPTMADKLRTLSPGVVLGQETCDLRAALGIAQELPLFLLPAGLRPVKGVIGLFQIFDRLECNVNPFHLAICGPILDEDYGRRVQSEVALRPWASYAGIIPPEAMADAMRDADVIINNSISEGLANSLLEAATLGIPILARNNPGNAALVRHDINGLLFDNDQDCLRHATRLLEKQYRRQLSRPDSSYRFEIEAQELQAILLEAVSHRSKGK